jgi:putative membrane protein
MPEITSQNLNDHLANERTYLAWIRTSIGIMAFGFVVVKFSLFVKQLDILLNKGHTISSSGNSVIMGIALVAVGSIVSILAFLRYRKTEKQINAGQYLNSSLLIILLTIFIFVISILLILYILKSI